MSEYVIVYLDKTMVRLSGLAVKGLNPRALEERLREFLGRPVRVIGVTGEAIEMDVYGLAPEAIRRDERGLIRAVALADGITATDLARIETAQRIVNVPAELIPRGPQEGCARERWLKLDQ